MNDCRYALLIDYEQNINSPQYWDDKLFVTNFLRAFGWREYDGVDNFFTYSDLGLEGIIKISGRIPASIMSRIRSIKVMRITDLWDVTDIIGVNLVTKG